MNDETKISVWDFIEAIRAKNYKRIDEILLNSDDNSNILTELDKAGDSAMYWALLMADMKSLGKIGNYIKKTEISKVKLDDELLGVLATVIEFPQTDELTPIQIIENYLEPLYLPESINKLIHLIGDDSIYPKKEFCSL